MPIYTRTGDDGQTGLFGNRRVPKDDARIEAYGTVDELNSVLGMLRAECSTDGPIADARIQGLQDTLFEIGADLATEGGEASVPRVEAAIGQLEAWIDESEAQLPALTSFVLPGGCRIAALLHLARTVSRRAERCYWTLERLVADDHPVPTPLGIYLNRLSDLCFSWARLANLRAGVEDIPWRREPS
jgi:cob(I)alamin adenosyltransferase